MGKTAGEPRTWTFERCWVNADYRYTETVFHDGTRVVAVPGDGFAYTALAESLGYAGAEADAQMSREHEILHTFLAERLLNNASPTLWAVAHDFEPGVTAPIWEQEIEEACVLAFQAFLNDVPGARDRAAQEAGRAPDEMDTLKADALTLLR